MVVKKPIIITCLSLVFCAFCIASFGLWKHLNKPASIEIVGLEHTDYIALEYGCLGQEPKIYQGDAKSFNSLALDLPDNDEQESYYVLSKLPEDNDVNIQINPKKKEITITAEGFEDNNLMTVEVEGRIVSTGGKPDWSGKYEYSHTYQEKFGLNPLVCLDVGGYRGSSMSICHRPKNKRLIHVIHSNGSDIPENFAHLILQNWVKGMMLMAQQMTTVIVSMTEQIGRFLDAKHQLESQRYFQEKTAEAMREYYPSEQICKIGTVMRDMAMIDERMSVTRNAINNQIRSRELISGNNIAEEPGTTDVLSRLNLNKTTYCNKNDGGMSRHCTSSEQKGSDSSGDGEDADDPAQRINKDVDYIRTIELPLTLNIDFLEEGSGAEQGGDDTGPAEESSEGETTSDETDVFQLLHSLFSDENFARFASGAERHENFKKIFRDMRSVVAMRGIARNSVANIIAQKAASANKKNDAGPYLKALIKEMGIKDTKAIEKILGENPSYFAKMEVLTKKLYQDPNFYANLYDKPANVSRMRTAMKAIKLMQDRDIYAALQRREMLFAMLLELRVREIENPSGPEGER